MTTAAQTIKSRAYSYLRFSTPEQQKGDSIRRQSVMAEDWYRRNGVELDTDLTFRDLGVSAFRGKNADEGELAAFREAVREGIVPQGSFLLIENFDRLSRMTPRKAVKVLEAIVEEGVAVVTLSDGKIYTEETLDDPLAFVMAVLTGMRAYEESKMKSARLKAAWQGKREKALGSDHKLTSICPGWLQLSADRSSFEVIADRAEVVRRIYEMALAGAGHTMIERTLNREDVSTFGEASQWHRGIVHRILRNEATVGIFTPHRVEYDETTKMKRRVPLEPVEGYYPAILDRETFDTVQAMLTNSSEAHTVRAPKGGTSFEGPRRNILASLARCPNCGSTMRRINKGGRNRAKLICSKAHAAAGCVHKAVDYTLVERALIENAAWLREHAPSKDEQLDADLSKARTELEVIEEQLGRVVDAIISVGSSELLSSKLKELEATKVETKARVKELEERAAGAEGVVLSKRLETLEDALSRGDLGKANAALRVLVSGVVVDYQTGDLRLQWRHDGETRLSYAMRVEA